MRMTDIGEGGIQVGDVHLEGITAGAEAGGAENSGGHQIDEGGSCAAVEEAARVLLPRNESVQFSHGGIESNQREDVPGTLTRSLEGTVKWHRRVPGWAAWTRIPLSTNAS